MKKKRYIVVPRTQEAQERGIPTGKGRLKFGKQTARWIDDPTLAGEIDKEHGRKGSMDVWVAEDENLEWHAKHDNGTDGRMAGIHHYTFAGVDMQGIRTTRDNGYVWIRRGVREIRVKREIAIAEGWIVSEKRRKRARTREVKHGPNP